MGIQTIKKDIKKYIRESIDEKHYDPEIWNVMMLIHKSFAVHNPVDYSKYAGWCSVHQPFLPKKMCYELLEKYTPDQYIDYVSSW
jgi:hypothetical protein